MTTLEQLIKELCPMGVIFSPLKQVAVSLPKGTIKQEQLLINGLYPVVNGGTTLYGFYNQFNNEGNAITVSSRGAAGFIQYMPNRFWAGGLCYPYRSVKEEVLLTN